MIRGSDAQLAAGQACSRSFCSSTAGAPRHVKPCHTHSYALRCNRARPGTCASGGRAGGVPCYNGCTSGDCQSADAPAAESKALTAGERPENKGVSGCARAGLQPIRASAPHVPSPACDGSRTSLARARRTGDRTRISRSFGSALCSTTPPTSTTRFAASTHHHSTSASRLDGRDRAGARSCHARNAATDGRHGPCSKRQ